MFRNLVLLFIGILIACGVGSSAIGADTFPPERCYGAEDERLEQKAAAFRRLRAIQGHFDGATWNDDVDKWMGRKHRLMLDLSTLLSEEKYDKTCVIQLLGPPDRVVHAADKLFDAIGGVLDSDYSTAASDEYLVYYWRGEHDFLFFICRDDVVINSGWWYAGE